MKFDSNNPQAKLERGCQNCLNLQGFEEEGLAPSAPWEHLSNGEESSVGRLPFSHGPLSFCAHWTSVSLANERKYERTDRLQLTYDAQEKKLRKSKLGTDFPQKKLEKKELRGFDDG